MADTTSALTPSIGLTVLHLFVKADLDADRPAVHAAVDAATERGCQVIVAAILGHKADACVLALAPDAWVLRTLQSDLRRAGLTTVDSYVSMTEVSEYAKGMPEEMLDARLYPALPPAGMRASASTRCPSAGARATTGTRSSTTDATR